MTNPFATSVHNLLLKLASRLVEEQSKAGCSGQLGPAPPPAGQLACAGQLVAALAVAPAVRLRQPASGSVRRLLRLVGAPELRLVRLGFAAASPRRPSKFCNHSMQ